MLFPEVAQAKENSAALGSSDVSRSIGTGTMSSVLEPAALAVRPER